MTTLAARLRTGVAAVDPAPTATAPCLDDPRIARRLDDPTGGPVARIDGLAELLGDRVPMVTGLVWCADPVCERGDTIDSWVTLARLSEAAWQLLSSAPAGRLGPAAAALLRPLAARLRFLVLSEPMRHRGAGPNPLVSSSDAEAFGPNGQLEEAFGQWEELVGRAQEARRVWLGFLDAYQSHPLLAATRPEDLERELDALTFAHGRVPLVLSADDLDQPTRPTADDRAVAADLRDRHLLPRFRLAAPTALAIYAADPAERRGRLMLGLATHAGWLAAAVLVGLRLLPGAAWAAAVTYLLIGIGVVVFGEEWAAPWLLRLPAAAAVGMLVLVSLPPDWWADTDRINPAVALGLPAAAWGYLVVEARNHGVAARDALLRSLAVAAVGLVHAGLIAVLGLIVLIPAFAEDGPGLAAVWTRAGPTYGVLTATTAWCLLVGVFSQILWDDRPITARLAHLSWRTGGPT